MDLNLVLIGAVLVVVSFLSMKIAKKIYLSGNLLRFVGIVSKLLQVIGVIIVVAGLANT